MSHQPHHQPRSRRGDSILHVLGRNLRYAVRRLRKSPGFTALAIISLAVGIGANTAVFSLVNAVLLRDAPITDPESLVEVYESTPDFPYNVLSYPDFEDLRDATEHIFSGISFSRFVVLQIDRGGEQEMLPGEAVTGNYFSLRGLTPAVGRLFGAEDDVAPGAHPVVVLSHGYWQRAFAADPATVGRELRIVGHSYTIVGVAPAEYRGNLRGLEPALYAPYMMIDALQPRTSSELEARGNHSLFATARLQPGVTLAEAQVAAESVAARLRADRIDNWDPQGKFNLVASADVLLFPPIDTFVRAAAWLLVVVVALVLVLACTNLASFLLARAVDRRREIAIRLALGARSRTLVAQLLTESALLGLVSGVAGVALGVGLLRLLLAVDLPLPIPITLDLRLDTTVLAFSFIVSLAAGLFLGLIPALQATRPDVVTALK